MKPKANFGAKREGRDMPKTTTEVTHTIIQEIRDQHHGKTKEVIGFAHTWQDGTIAMEFTKPHVLTAKVLLVPRK